MADWQKGGVRNNGLSKHELLSSFSDTGEAGNEIAAAAAQASAGRFDVVNPMSGGRSPRKESVISDATDNSRPSRGSSSGANILPRQTSRRSLDAINKYKKRGARGVKVVVVSKDLLHARAKQARRGGERLPALSSGSTQLGEVKLDLGLNLTRVRERIMDALGGHLKLPKHFCFVEDKTVLSILQERSKIREWNRIEIFGVQQPPQALIANDDDDDDDSLAPGQLTAKPGSTSDKRRGLARTLDRKPLRTLPISRADKSEELKRFCVEVRWNDVDGLHESERQVKYKTEDDVESAQRQVRRCCTWDWLLDKCNVLARMSKTVAIIALVVIAICVALAGISATSYYAGRQSLKLSLTRLDQSRSAIVRNNMENMLDRMDHIAFMGAQSFHGSVASSQGSLRTTCMPNGTVLSLTPSPNVPLSNDAFPGWLHVEAFADLSTYPTASKFVPSASTAFSAYIVARNGSMMVARSVEGHGSSTLSVGCADSEWTARVFAAIHINTTANTRHGGWTIHPNHKVSISDDEIRLTISHPVGDSATDFDLVSVCEISAPALGALINRTFMQLKFDRTAVGLPTASVINSNGTEFVGPLEMGPVWESKYVDEHFHTQVVTEACADAGAEASVPSVARDDQQNGELITAARVRLRTPGLPLCLVLRSSQYPLFCSNIGDDNCPTDSFGSLGSVATVVLGSTLGVTFLVVLYYLRRAQKRARSASQSHSSDRKLSAVQLHRHTGKREQARRDALEAIVVMMLLLVATVMYLWLDRTRTWVNNFSYHLTDSFAVEFQSAVSRGFSAPFILTRLNHLEHRKSMSLGTRCDTKNQLEMLRPFVQQFQAFQSHQNGSWPFDTNWMWNSSNDAYMAVTTVNGVLLADTICPNTTEGFGGRWAVNCSSPDQWRSDDHICFVQQKMTGASGAQQRDEVSRAKSLAKELHRSDSKPLVHWSAIGQPTALTSSFSTIDAVSGLTPRHGAGRLFDTFGVRVRLGSRVRPAEVARNLDFGPKGFAFATTWPSHAARAVESYGDTIADQELLYFNSAVNGSVGMEVGPPNFHTCTTAGASGASLSSTGSPIGAVASELMKLRNPFNGVQTDVGYGDNTTWLKAMTIDLGQMLGDAANGTQQWALIVGMSQQFLLSTVEEWSAVNFLVASAIVFMAVTVASTFGTHLISHAIRRRTGTPRKARNVAAISNPEVMNSLYRRLEPLAREVGHQFGRKAKEYRYNQKKRTEPAQADVFARAERRNRCSNTCKALMNCCRNMFNSVVHRANERMYDFTDNEDIHDERDRLDVARTQRALRHLDGSFSGMDSLKILGLENEGAAVTMQLYYFSCSRVYKWLIDIAMAAHLALAFGEGRPNVNSSTVRNYMLAEAACIGLYAADLVLAYKVSHSSITIRDIDDDAGGSESIRSAMRVSSRFSSSLRSMLRAGSSRRRRNLTITEAQDHEYNKARRMEGQQLSIRFSLILIFVADILVRAILGYSSGRKSNLSLPYSALLRPAFVFTRNRKLWRELRNVIATLFQVRDVLKMALQYMVCAAIAAGVFFKANLRKNVSNGLLGRGFSDFRNSWLSMWVFVTSGENLEDVLQADDNMFSKYLFILVAFVGMFIIVAALIARFQQVHAKRDEQERYQRSLQRRQGIVVAFVILDEDDSEILTFDRYYHLLKTLSGARRLGNLRDYDHGGLRLLEFVDILEKVLYTRAMKHSESTTYVRAYGRGGLLTGRREKLLDFHNFDKSWFERTFSLYGQTGLLPWLDQFSIVIIAIQVVTLSLVGTFVGNDVLAFQRATPVFLILNVVEVLLRIAIMSWRGYWNDNTTPYGTARARFDVGVVATSCTLWLVSTLPESVIGNMLHAADSAKWSGLLALVLPLLRMFSSVKSSRELVFGMVHVLRACPPLLSVLLLVCFGFAMVGLLLFQGQLDGLPSTVYNGSANFNTLARSFLAVLQLCHGEGWDNIMYATIDAEHSLWPAFYYVTFTLFVLILLSNIVVGVIIEAFRRLKQEEEKLMFKGLQDKATPLEKQLIKLCRRGARDTNSPTSTHDRAESRAATPPKMEPTVTIATKPARAPPPPVSQAHLASAASSSPEATVTQHSNVDTTSLRVVGNDVQTV